jgi:hypothetical protein
MKYVVKLKYNGTDNRIFDNPKDAVDCYQKHLKDFDMPSLWGSLESKIEEMQWIEKLQIIENKC